VGAWASIWSQRFVSTHCEIHMETYQQRSELNMAGASRDYASGDPYGVSIVRLCFMSLVGICTSTCVDIDDNTSWLPHSSLTAGCTATTSAKSLKSKFPIPSLSALSRKSSRTRRNLRLIMSPLTLSLSGRSPFLWVVVCGILLPM
jgi:hypothetical protein